MIRPQIGLNRRMSLPPVRTNPASVENLGPFALILPLVNAWLQGVRCT
jgi:hypothetical protein